MSFSIFSLIMFFGILLFFQNGLHHHITVEYEEDRDDHSEDDGRSGSKANGIVKINMPMAEREEQRYPKEKLKTFIGDCLD